MSVISSFTTRHRFDGFRVAVNDNWRRGEVASITVEIAAPDRSMPGALLAFTPGTPGFDEAREAVRDCGERVADLLEWVIENTRIKLDTSDDIPAELRAYWERVIELADHSRAEFYARYPDGIVPAFEVIGRLIADARQLIGAAPVNA